MSGLTNMVRVNISFPREVLEAVKKRIEPRGFSRFLSEAAKEKIAKMERDRALREILEAKSSFAAIKNSSKYVRRLRHMDERRMKRLEI